MHGIIFICDKCLKELIISQKDFDPVDVSKMVAKCSKATGWIIPDLVMKAENLEGHKIYAEVPSSEINCLCPICRGI